VYKPYQIRKLRKLTKIVNRCSNAFVLQQPIGPNCKNYCELYKLNSISPIFEGPIAFFYKVIQELQVYLHKENVYDNVRLLEEKPKDGKAPAKAPEQLDVPQKLNFP